MNDILKAKQIVNNPTLFAKKILGFNPLSYQEEFLQSCKDNNRIVGIWSRQSGKTTTLAAYVCWHAVKFPNEEVIIISPTQTQSDRLFNKIRFFMQSNDWTKDLITRLQSDFMSLENNTTIKSLPVGPYGTTILGHSASLIILEESGSIKDSIISEVVLPMGAAKPNLKIIQIGTPKGKNHFYEAFVSPRYKVHQYSYEIPLKEGLYTEEYIEEQKDDLNELQFKTEYCAEFIEDIDAYFKQELISSCVEDYQLDNQKHPDEEFSIGVDLARMGEDKSTFIVLGRNMLTNKIRVVMMEETHKKLLTDAIGRVKILFDFWKPRLVWLDSTGLGAGPGDILREALGGKVMPLTFTQKSKQDIYSNLKGWMEKGLVTLPNHRRLLYELADLRYKIHSTGQMSIHHSEKGHDDYPDALALAIYTWKHRMKPSWGIA